MCELLCGLEQSALYPFNFEADPDPGHEDLLIFKQKNFKISLLLFLLFLS